MLSYTCSAQSRPAIFIPTESNIASSRFASLEGSTETFIEEQENQNKVKKTKWNIALLTEFLSLNKGRNRKWNSWNSSCRGEWNFEWIYFKRSHKEEQDYEPSSLRGMVASFERHLKRKSYPVSIINDLEVCPWIFMKVADCFWQIRLRFALCYSA